MAMGARRAEGNVTYDQECRYSVEEYVNILLQTLYPPYPCWQWRKDIKNDPRIQSWKGVV